MAQTSKLGFILAFVVSGVNVYDIYKLGRPFRSGRMLFQLDPFFLLVHSVVPFYIFVNGCEAEKQRK